MEIVKFFYMFCGSQVIPDASSERCKVAIGSCKLHAEYKILVAAVSAGYDSYISNDF
jgi:hypothetical protein